MKAPGGSGGEGGRTAVEGVSHTRTRLPPGRATGPFSEGGGHTGMIEIEVEM